MTVQLARPMTDPATIKQFKEDFEVVRSGQDRALRFLQAARRRQEDAKIMRANRIAAEEVGRALARMRETKSYEDNYRSWSDLCRALKLAVRDSYHLMDLREVIESLAGTSMAAEPISRRQARVLRKVAPEERAPVLAAAKAEGGATPANLERFRQQLGAHAREKGRTEAEAPRQKKERSSGAMQAVKRYITSALAVKLPEEAPPVMVEELHELLQKAADVADRISLAIAPV